MIVWICLHSNVSGGLRKTFSFLQEWRFARSRSSKVIYFGTNRKRVRDIVTLVLEILQVFVLMTAPYFTLFYPILRVLPLDQMTADGVNLSRYLKLVGHEIIFEVFQRVWKTPENHRRSDGRTDGQTDGQTDYVRSCCAKTARCGIMPKIHQTRFTVTSP